MGLQALIFDVDGTLAETAEIHRAAFNQAFEEFQTGWSWDRQVFSYLNHLTDDMEMLRGYNAMPPTRLNITKFEPQVLRDISVRKLQIYLSMIANGAARLRPGVARLIDESIREKVALGIVSSRKMIEFEMLVTNTLGFQSLSDFQSVQTAQNCNGNVFTAYQQVIRELGINPEKSVAIDDSESGIRAAASCGLNTIATPGIYTSSGRFDAACVVVSDLGKPAQPYNIIQGKADETGYISAAYLQHLVDQPLVAA